MNIEQISKELSKVESSYSFVDNNSEQNIRPSSLEIGKWYIMFIYHLPKNESPFVLVKFLGSGKEPSNKSDNIKLVNMKVGEYYWFESYDIDSNESYIFGSHVFDGKLCVTEKSKRVSFKDLRI